MPRFQFVLFRLYQYSLPLQYLWLSFIFKTRFYNLSVQCYVFGWMICLGTVKPKYCPRPFAIEIDNEYGGNPRYKGNDKFMSDLICILWWYGDHVFDWFHITLYWYRTTDVVRWVDSCFIHSEHTMILGDRVLSWLVTTGCSNRLLLHQGLLYKISIIELLTTVLSRQQTMILYTKDHN